MCMLWKLKTMCDKIIHGVISDSRLAFSNEFSICFEGAVLISALKCHCRIILKILHVKMLGQVVHFFSVKFLAEKLGDATYHCWKILKDTRNQCTSGGVCFWHFFTK